MTVSGWKRAGVALTAAAVVTGLAGCEDGDAKSAGQSAGKAVGKSANDVTAAITAAFEKTSKAKAAKFTMTMEMSGTGATDGTTTMSGVQGWDPTVMDVTMEGGMLAGARAGADGVPGKIRMIMRDNVMYTEMGADMAKKFDGKSWMKMDFDALAKESGDPSLKAMTANMSGSNQDPAQQLAILLQARGIKHIGPEKIKGTDTEHYKGTVSVDDMMKADKNLGAVPEKDREAIVETMKTAGLKSYDTELWVDKDGYPAKMVVGMKMARGSVKVTAFYSDYGTKAEVTPPPAGKTLDLQEMMKKMMESAADADAAADSAADSADAAADSAAAADAAAAAAAAAAGASRG
ncbi:hypothetical protein AB0C52_26070 [Streptomyces sp. NPDC048717]|uniref:hypothetical protein n=1 Tax=Streptomyces sp. NPDC048717 TaxID=3154928 RepID=UPI003431A4D1